MVSYEIALGLSLVGVLILAGTFSLRGIVEAQAGHFWGFIPNWFIFRGGQFVAFFIYLTAAYAETNRIPFDLPEAETELVAGYHTEYSAMKFAMFFMAEYANMVTVACLASLLFLGGWSGPLFGPAGCKTFAAGLVRVAGFWISLCLYLGARHVAAFPLRSTHGVRMEIFTAAGDRKLVVTAPWWLSCVLK